MVRWCVSFCFRTERERDEEVSLVHIDDLWFLVENISIQKCPFYSRDSDVFIYLIIVFDVCVGDVDEKE